MEPYKFTVEEKKVIEKLPVPLLVYHLNKVDKQCSLVSVSDGACNYFSLDRDVLIEFLQSGIKSSIMNSDLEKLKEYNRSLFEESNEEYNFAFRIKFLGHTNYKWVNAKGNYKKIDDSNYIYYIYLSDCSDICSKSKQLNEFLSIFSTDVGANPFSNNINNLHEAMIHARFFYWVYDVKSKLLISGNCFPELLSSNTTIPNYPEFLFEQGLNHIDDKQKYYDMFNEILHGKNSASANIRVYDISRQKYVLAHIRLNAVYDSEHKLTQIIGTSESLSSYEEMYKTTQEVLSKNGLITWTYHIEQNQYNFNEPKVISQSLRDNYNLIISSIKSHQIIISPAMIARKKESDYKIVEIRNTDGKIKKFEITYTFINDKNHNPLYILGIARDVTSYYEREKGYIEKLEKSNINKSIFLSHLSHDMRTPLGAISSISEFGLEDIKDPIAISYFEKIHDNSKYLLSFISDVLEARKIDSSLFEIHAQIYEGSRIFNEIVSVIKPRAEEKNIQLFTQIESPHLGLYVYSDVAKLKQIAINILSNAIKYTPRNGIVEFIVDSIKVDDVLKIKAKIQDNGVGMSKKFQLHMFEEYSQEENRLSFEEEGTGLGLSIAKRTLDAMGGSISCTSELNRGTTFNITLDMKIATQEQIDEHNRIICISHLNLLNGRKILICEDKPINVMIVQKLLNDKGIVVDIAENGKVGIEKARSNDYDIILMDIRMPVVDGLTAAKIIRGFNEITPIIALSANAYAEDIKKSLEAGMNAHLSKPIDKDELYETIIRNILKD